MSTTSAQGFINRKGVYGSTWDWLQRHSLYVGTIFLSGIDIEESSIAEFSAVGGTATALSVRYGYRADGARDGDLAGTAAIGGEIEGNGLLEGPLGVLGTWSTFEDRIVEMTSAGTPNNADDHPGRWLDSGAFFNGLTSRIRFGSTTGTRSGANVVTREDAAGTLTTAAAMGFNDAVAAFNDTRTADRTGAAVFRVQFIDHAAEARDIWEGFGLERAFGPMRAGSMANLRLPGKVDSGGGAAPGSIHLITGGGADTGANGPGASVGEALKPWLPLAGACGERVRDRIRPLVCFGPLRGASPACGAEQTSVPDLLVWDQVQVGRCLPRDWRGQCQS